MLLRCIAVVEKMPECALAARLLHACLSCFSPPCCWRRPLAPADAVSATSVRPDDKKQGRDEAVVRDKEDGKLEVQEAQEPDCKGKKGRKRPGCEDKGGSEDGSSLAIAEAGAAKAAKAQAQAAAALPAQTASSAAMEQGVSEPWLADAQPARGDRVAAAALSQASMHPIQLPECSLGTGLTFVGDYTGDKVGWRLLCMHAAACRLLAHPDGSAVATLCPAHSALRRTGL